MDALVTGGAGFIGSTLVDRLLDDGDSVTVIDNFASGKRTNLEQARSKNGERLTVHEMDIRSPEVVALIESAKPNIVFHLAAQMDVRVSVADPIYDASVNILGSLNVLEGTRRAEARKLVFASSGGTIYGDAPDNAFPVDENVPKLPSSPYGISKRVMSDYLDAYKNTHGLDYAALALGNVFGPRQDPHGEAGVVAIFCQKLLSGGQCTIFGDGSATRDYVYVDDVVRAFVAAATQGSGLYNVGSGVETSTKELYFALARAAGVDEPPTYAPPRPGELQRNWLDISKAANELRWSPTVGLEDGAQLVLSFVRSQNV